MSEQARRRVIPFYTIRLRDLTRPRARLIAKCGFCGRTCELDVLRLAWTRGPDTRVTELERKLRCEQCDARGWVSLSLEWVE